jgi:hypothetical protein
MECAGTGNDSHGGEVNTILNGRDLTTLAHVFK